MYRGTSLVLVGARSARHIRVDPIFFKKPGASGGPWTPRTANVPCRRVRGVVLMRLVSSDVYYTRTITELYMVENVYFFQSIHYVMKELACLDHACLARERVL